MIYHISDHFAVLVFIPRGIRGARRGNIAVSFVLPGYTMCHLTVTAALRYVLISFPLVRTRLERDNRKQAAEGVVIRSVPPIHTPC